MNEAVLEFLKELEQKGVSWGMVITCLILFNKIQRNKEFRLRDQRVERNQRRIMEHLGVEGEWATPPKTLKQMVRRSLRRLYSSSPEDIPLENQLRRKKNMEKLKSRKLWMAIFAALLPIANEEFGLGLNVETVIASVGAIVAYILGQAHVDAKKLKNGGTADEKRPTDTDMSV